MAVSCLPNPVRDNNHNPDPRAFAMTRLLLMALERHLEPTMYHANLAKCYSSIDWGHTGLTFSFTVQLLLPLTAPPSMNQLLLLFSTDLLMRAD